MDDLHMVPNVTLIGKYPLRNIYLDMNLTVCPLSDDPYSVEDGHSYQTVHLRNPQYRVSYDPVQDNLMGIVVAPYGKFSRAMKEEELSQALDACGLSLLAWLTADIDTVGHDIRNYVNPDILNHKQIVRTHELYNLFPNMPLEFVENVVKGIQSGLASGGIIEIPLGMKPAPIPNLSGLAGNSNVIKSSAVSAFANRRTVRPKVINVVKSIPKALPIAYYQYGNRPIQHVKSSLYITDEHGVESVVNLTELVSLLNIPRGWFTSIVYTLPTNIQQVVHVVHKPFLNQHCSRSRGTIITVYTC